MFKESGIIFVECPICTKFPWLLNGDQVANIKNSSPFGRVISKSELRRKSIKNSLLMFNQTTKSCFVTLKSFKCHIKLHKRKKKLFYFEWKCIQKPIIIISVIDNNTLSYPCNQQHKARNRPISTFDIWCQKMTS